MRLGTLLYRQGLGGYGQLPTERDGLRIARQSWNLVAPLPRGVKQCIAKQRFFLATVRPGGKEQVACHAALM